MNLFENQKNILQILTSICQDFNLGSYISSTVVNVGYEDLNYILESSSGKYFVKIFQNRAKEDINRLISCILKAIQGGVHHPKFYEGNQGYLYNKDDLSLCVLEYVNGKSFYDLNLKPSFDELRFLAQQSALIHQMDLKPMPTYNQWALVNFVNEYNTKKSYLKKDDIKFIKPLYKIFGQINFEKLPHTFVHGDIVATNVLKDKNNKIYIIDFGVSNYYPRIIDLAVIMSNLCLVEDKNETIYRENILIEEYQKYTKLSDEEIGLLPIFTRAANALHILGVNYEETKNYTSKHSKENTYWLNQGRLGLSQYME
jgi:Ser/Thr protein kinase RdoA (MazF antagonist)